MARKYSRKGGKTFRRKNKSFRRGGSKKYLRRSKQRGGNWSSKPCKALVGAPWNVNNDGNHFALNVPIGVGGQKIYPGNNSPQPQRTWSTAGNSSTLRGGKRRKRKAGKKTKKFKRRMRGGAPKKGSVDANASSVNCPTQECATVNPNLKVPDPDSLLPQPLVNAYRVGKTNALNAFNVVQGLPLIDSPLPYVQKSMQI